MQRPKAWQENWEVVRRIEKQGAQGDAYIVRRKGESEQFFLKELKSETWKAKKSRNRLAEEVISLQRVHDYPRIPRVVESNTSAWQDNLVALYVVTEFIEGQTLDQALRAWGQPTVPQAARVVLQLLETVQYCHSNDVTHRDIKPKNVMVRGSNWASAEAVLLDFGISFNAPQEESETADLTHAGERVGNKFLPLPEHQPGSDNKRSQVSDRTQCIGLLLFLVTSKEPGPPHDGTRFAHEQPAAEQALSCLEKGYRKQLERIFKREFRLELDLRHTDDLASEVAKLTGDPQSLERIPVHQRMLNRARSFEENPAVFARNMIEEGLGALHAKLNQLASHGQTSLGPHGYLIENHTARGETSLKSGMREHLDALFVRYIWKNQKHGLPDLTVKCRVDFNAAERRVIVTTNEATQSLDLVDPALVDRIFEIIEDHCSATFDKWLDDHESGEANAG